MGSMVCRVKGDGQVRRGRTVCVRALRCSRSQQPAEVHHMPWCARLATPERDASAVPQKRKCPCRRQEDGNSSGGHSLALSRQYPPAVHLPSLVGLPPDRLRRRSSAGGTCRIGCSGRWSCLHDRERSAVGEFDDTVSAQQCPHTGSISSGDMWRATDPGCLSPTRARLIRRTEG